ncbi:MAG: FemAB family XrtA/PEP-CTERM system-associated protein [Phycisphaerae bacterium]
MPHACSTTAPPRRPARPREEPARLDLCPAIDADAPAWERYAAEHADGTVHHRWGWAQAVQRAFGHTGRHLIARRGSRVAGILPLTQVNSRIAGRMLISVPYGIYGGPLADDDAVAAALLARARALADELSARVLELRCLRPCDESLPIATRHVTFRRTLPARVDEVADWLPRKARAAARRAGEKHTLEVAFDRAAVGTAWRLYAATMRRLGSINYPRAFFEALSDELRDDCRVQIVYCRHGAQRRAVAGLLTLRHGETALPYLVGYDERADIYGLTNFLYCESMRDAVACGCRVYDFGRSRVDNAGSVAFKESFGFEATPLAYQAYVPGGAAPPDLDAGSRRWAAARAAWRWLPLPVTRWLGGVLAGSIPG